MEQILYRYNPWWESDYNPTELHYRPSLFRDIETLIASKDIIFFTGLRRIGKTSLLKLIISFLINQKNVKSNRIFYVSLDDYLLAKHNIIEIVDEFRKIQKIKFSEKIYLFLDEIGYKEDFEIQIKNFYDNQNVKIFSSTSNSFHLRSKKIFITGRHKTIEVPPLDFEEYLSFKNISISKKEDYLFDKYFLEYLFTGGIPEFVLRGEIEYLKELVDDIIMKDIAAQHNIKNIALLKDFFLLLMERVGKVFSINKLANILQISPDTAKRYLELFNSTYLIHLMPRAGKTNEIILSAKKIYAADLGIKTLFTGFKDKGNLFENYVYLKLKDRNPAYVYVNGSEIDFLTEDKTLIEVKFDSELTKAQEKLFSEFKAKNKIIIKNFRDIKSVISK